MKNPPIAKSVTHKMSIHGHERTDDYFWMKERENPEVIEHLKAENQYAADFWSERSAIGDELYEELIGRLQKNDASAPYQMRGFWYYHRYEEGKEHAIHCRKKSLSSEEEEILLDVNELADGKAYCSVNSLRISPDNKLLAYGVDFESRRKYTIYFKDIESGKLLDLTVPNCSGIAVWAADSDTFFYSKKNDDTLRQERILKNKLSTKEEQLVFFEEDETFFAGVGKSKSGKYIMIRSSSTLTTEYRYLEAANPDAESKIFQPRVPKLEYYVVHMDDRFFVLTNKDAKNFCLMFTMVDKTEAEHWQIFIAHSAEVLLENLEAFQEHLVVTERKDGLNHLRVVHLPSGEEHYLPFDEPAYSAQVDINRELASETLRYSYSSLSTPHTVYDYNMRTRERLLIKQQPVLGGFDQSKYTVERRFATAADGTKIPLSIVYRTDIPRDGSQAGLLYGYGSYGNSIDPGFQSSVVSLLDRGFSYAIAHIRGGEEMGRSWYEDGKLLNKKNTFTDFIDCGEFMISAGLSHKDKLYGLGGSAGGLLIGAVMNMRPDLFDGLIAVVPFVDVVTTMLDDSIPLTTFEYDEWGNPNNEQFYQYMLSYSPYDNVVAKDYPNLLVMTGFHDSQVQYWEPAKWVAKLRELKTDDKLVLFDTNMDAGHSGASGRYQPYKELAKRYNFLLHLAEKA